MRTELAFFGILGFCAVAAGCGAKVTVDLGGPSATGGAGGTTTSTGTPTDTTGSGITCGSVNCSGASDGSCDCTGVCNGQKLEVQCVPIQGGESCTCTENGIKIANCTQAGTATCNFSTECCGPQFFGGSTGAGG
jgi:hypothetical protein